MLLGILLGATAGAIAGLIIKSQYNSSLSDTNNNGRGFINNIKHQFSTISEFLSDKFSGNSNIYKENFRESKLERTRSTASQFNSH